MAYLDNHPGMWLRDDAAAAINALEAKYGPIIINRAGQTEADQQKMIDKWDRGDRAGMFEPKRPARLSTHVMNGGEAVDVYNYTDDRPKLEEFGFEWYGPDDPVHYTFRGWAPPTAKRKRVNNMDIILEINGKIYAIDHEYVKHCDSVAQVNRAKKDTGVPHVKLGNGIKALEAFNEYLNYYGIPLTVFNNSGLVLNPQSGKFAHGNVWSRNREILSMLS